MLPLSAPNVDIITAIEIKEAPLEPKIFSAAVAATKGDFAISSIGSTYKKAALIKT